MSAIPNAGMQPSAIVTSTLAVRRWKLAQPSEASSGARTRTICSWTAAATVTPAAASVLMRYVKPESAQTFRV